MTWSLMRFLIEFLTNLPAAKSHTLSNLTARQWRIGRQCRPHQTCGLANAALCPTFREIRLL